MSTFDDNFPAKGSPKMADRLFGFDSENLKNAGMTNQALYDLFKGNLEGEFPTAASLLPAFDLDNIRVMTSTAPDNKLIKSNVLEPITGRYVTFREYTGITPIVDGTIFVNHGGKVYKRTDKEYYIESFGVLGVGNDSQVFQKALDGVAQTESKKLVIDGFDLILTTQVTSSADGLTIEFRNNGQISQPTPATNTTWEDHNLRLLMSGNDLTLINYKTDGKFNNEGLNAIPSPVRHFTIFTGNNVRFLGKTDLQNSGGYNLDIRGDRCYIEDIFGKNNAYSSLRFMAAGARQFFRVGKAEFIQNFGPIARKTGLTVNGQNQVQLIEIDSYIGLNASPFTEATVGGTGDFYQNVKIGYLRNDYNVDTEYPNGDPAASFSGKMENVVNLTIGRIDNFNNSPLNKGQGMWFSQSKSVKIGEIHTNAGDWILGNYSEIGIFNFIHSGNSGDVLMATRGTQARVVIQFFVCDIPIGATPYAGIFRADDITKKFVLNNYKAINNDIGLTRANPDKIADQFSINDEYRSSLINMSTMTGAVRQNISYPLKKSYVVSPTSITRDVVIGESFFFTTQTNFTNWVVRVGGTCSWSGSTFTGTAKFTKYFINQNYAGAALSNFTALLTDDDRGQIIARINGLECLWSGTVTGWVPINKTAPISADTASSVGAAYSQSEVQAILTELRDLKTKMRNAGLLAT